ncbi:unnamed protein product [Periconia digitata]|uniref:RING-type domain-containing protein n=1 Tax=Periconia digitata TaxID=1303443 RepID=A0A9W4XRE5_9PLEO|nr:unnamed protein product [Periconia digitata]
MDQVIGDHNHYSSKDLAAAATLVGLGLRVQDAPASSEVYRQVKRRRSRLDELRELIRYEEASLMPIYDDYMANIRYRWAAENPSTPFRISASPAGRAILQAECIKARTWLLDLIKLHQKIDRSHTLRILRSMVEKQAGIDSRPMTELEQFYMKLTDPDEDGHDTEWDFEDHLDATLTLTIHNNWAETHKDTLERLRQVASRAPFRSLSPSQLITHRMVQKMRRTNKIDAFACAIPLSTIKQHSKEEQLCPICQNEYLDLHKFSIKDLIADYPVRMKYCGHIIGKSCLETWMATPLVDPARYPYRTCPICRVPIGKRCASDVPEAIHNHACHNAYAKKIRQERDLAINDISDGILGCISEELVVQQLMVEVRQQQLDGNLDKLKERECKEVLERSLKALEEEKRMWGFEEKDMSKMWEKVSSEWIESGAHT